MVKTLISLLILSTLRLGLTAQVDHIARYETVHQSRNWSYLVIPNQDDGLLLIKPMASNSVSNSKIEFEHLGFNLEEKWRGSLEMPSRFQLSGYYYTANVTYLMFQVRSDNRFIRIVTIDTSKKEIKSFEPRQILNLTIFEFDIINGSAIIGGYIDQRPAVYVYDMEKDEVHTLANIYQNDSELLEVRVNNDRLTFNVLISKMDDQQGKTIQVGTYDYLGSVLRSYQLENNPKYQLLSGQSSSIYDKSQVVVGLYTKQAGNYPSGFFINHVNKIGQQTMQYMNFGEFDTFLNHLGEKRSARIKSRAIAGKENNNGLGYKINVLSREMVEVDGKLVLFGEYFKPWSVGGVSTWRNRNQYAKLSSFNNPLLYPNALSRSVAYSTSGIGFKSGFALVLDQGGRILWDGAMDINKNINGVLNELGAFQWHDGNAYYAYHHKDELRVKNLNETENPKGDVVDLVLSSEADQLSKGAEAPIKTVAWYNNQFLIYGIQYVRPVDKSESTRKVFFINAVELGPNIPEKEDQK